MNPEFLTYSINLCARLHDRHEEYKEEKQIFLAEEISGATDVFTKY